MQFLPDRTLVFFRYGNQCLLQKLALKPPLQIACHGINEPLLFRHQEGLVFRIEHAQLPADRVIGADLGLQLVRKTLTLIFRGKPPAVELDHSSGNFRKLHGGYDVLENLLAGTVQR